MKGPSFVYEEAPLCRLRNVAQTKISNYFESVIPKDRGELNDSRSIAKFPPVQSYLGHTALRGEVSCIFRFYEVFGIENVLRRCGGSVTPQRSDAIKKPYSCELPRLNRKVSDPPWSNMTSSPSGDQSFTSLRDCHPRAVRHFEG